MTWTTGPVEYAWRSEETAMIGAILSIATEHENGKRHRINLRRPAMVTRRKARKNPAKQTDQPGTQHLCMMVADTTQEREMRKTENARPSNLAWETHSIGPMASRRSWWRRWWNFRASNSMSLS